MQARSESRVLVADIGGTNCRLALARMSDARPELESLRVVPTPRGRIEATLHEFLDSLGVPRPAGVAIAAAGRVRRDSGRASVSLTNAALLIEREPLAALGGGRAWLLNDLGAVAAALPWLRPHDLHALGPPCPAAHGTRLVIGIGTGFGAAALTAAGETLESEAGHADLPATNAAEREWIARLAGHGRVSVEDVLSGPGLLRLHRATTDKDHALDTETLIARAHDDDDARKTCAAFSTWLGRVAGNLVLSLGAWGGVYLIGGVATGLGRALDATAFRTGFQDKPPFGADLATVPVHLIRHSQPALLGLAGIALGQSA